MEEEVQMIPVNSSNVASIGFDAGAEEIHVRFISGGTYVYSEASLDLWEAFQGAGSKGSFVQRILKAQCPARRIG